jgi:HEAT repeat protein/transposase-like protein
MFFDEDIDDDLTRFERLLKHAKERASYLLWVALTVLVIALLTLTGLGLWMGLRSYRYTLALCGAAVSLCVLYTFFHFRFHQLVDDYVNGLIEPWRFSNYSFLKPLFSWYVYLFTGIVTVVCFVAVFQSISTYVPITLLQTAGGSPPRWRDWALFGADKAMDSLLIGIPKAIGMQLSSITATGVWGRGLLLAFRLIVNYYLVMAVKEKYDLHKTIKSCIRALAVDSLDAIDRLARLGSYSVHQLIKELRRNDSNNLWGVATALGEIGDSRAVKALTQALGLAKDQSDRGAIIGALASIGGRDAIAGVRLVLEDPDPEIREAALAALAYLGAEEERDELLNGLHDNDSNVRKLTLGALVHMVKEKQVPPVEMHRIAALVGDPSSEVRWSALYALAELYGESAIPEIERALEDPVAMVRGVAVERLAELGASSHGLGEVIEESEGIAPQYEGLCVELFRTVRWRDGIRCPRCGSKDVGERGSYLEVFRRYYCEACNRIFNDKTGTIFAHTRTPLSTWFLAIHLLRTGAGDSDFARQLNMSERSARRMKIRLQDSPLADELFTAFQLEGRESLGKVLDLLADEGEQVRREVLEALVESGSPYAVPYVVIALKDHDEGARVEALRGIARFGVREAIPSVIDCLKDPSEWVRGGAADTLRELGERSAVPALIDAYHREDDAYTKHRLQSALAEIADSRAVDVYLDVLASPDSWDHRQAIRALKKVPDRRAVPRLIELIESSDSPWLCDVIDLLVVLKAREAAPQIEACVEHEDARVRKSAIMALGVLGREESKKAMRKAMRTRDVEVHILAAQSLWMLGERTRALESLHRLHKKLRRKLNRRRQLDGEEAWGLIQIGEALGEVGEEYVAIELLQEVSEKTGEENWGPRSAARDLLRKFGGTSPDETALGSTAESS